MIICPILREVGGAAERFPRERVRRNMTEISAVSGHLRSKEFFKLVAIQISILQNLVQ